MKWIYVMECWYFVITLHVYFCQHSLHPQRVRCRHGIRCIHELHLHMHSYTKVKKNVGAMKCKGSIRYFQNPMNFPVMHADFGFLYNSYFWIFNSVVFHDVKRSDQQVLINEALLDYQGSHARRQAHTRLKHLTCILDNTKTLWYQSNWTRYLCIAYCQIKWHFMFVPNHRYD